MCDYDMPEFFEETWVIARKQHSCCECGGVIDKGTKYLRATGKWNGEVDTYKICWFCDSVRDELYNMPGEECLAYFMGLKECMAEHCFMDRPVIYLDEKEDYLENLTLNFEEEEIKKDYPHMLSVWHQEHAKWADDIREV